jgi:hypothetical protein
LLDAMYKPSIAVQLRRRGHDVVAAGAEATLAALADSDLFASAQAELQTIVTENIQDFLQLDQQYRSVGRGHYGIILTSDRRFSRGSARHIGELVRALDRFLAEQPAEPAAASLVHWLR